MKVYLVLEYDGDICNIVGVHATRCGADKQAERTRSEDYPDVTYHVIERGVKGLSDMRFKFDSAGRHIIFNKNKA